MARQVDVAIIGGGPGGSTCGAFLKKYRPKMSVAIFEREKFPRDHIGESQLPIIGPILDEIGVWDRVETAGFPIKIGATYRWGNSDDLWDFNFLPDGAFLDEARPAKFEGQRRQTAFQVDRSVYDQILLDFAREVGCEVQEEAPVRRVVTERNSVTGLTLGDGAEVSAKYYVDASGNAGVLRRALGIPIEEPSRLRNVAFWDYWQNAEWAVSLGVGGTRIQVMSIGYGWLWFIPIGPTRTSIGLVCPADHYKQSGMSPEQLYLKAIEEEPRIRGLVSHATREEQFATTKDWSFVSEKMTGENWMLVGEAAGFADPILSAGLTLTHSSAREAAYSIMEVERGGDRAWLFGEYESRNRRRVLQHIRFADYWYSSNHHFSDLKEYTREIARDAGLELDAEKAFQWIGTGGFVDETIGAPGVGVSGLGSVYRITARLSEKPADAAFAGYNGFVLNLDDATRGWVPAYENGRVHKVPSYSRGSRLLPLTGLVSYVLTGLRATPRIFDAFPVIEKALAQVGIRYDEAVHGQVLICLDSLVRDGWILPRRYKNGPVLEGFSKGSRADDPFIQTNHDEDLPEERRASTIGS